MLTLVFLSALVGTVQLIVSDAAAAGEGRIIETRRCCGSRNHREGISAILVTCIFVLDARRNGALVILRGILRKGWATNSGQHNQSGDKLLHITSPEIETLNLTGFGDRSRQLAAANSATVMVTHRRRPLYSSNNSFRTRIIDSHGFEKNVWE
jgi:hypothetical protein